MSGGDLSAVESEVLEALQTSNRRAADALAALEPRGLLRFTSGLRKRRCQAGSVG